jgi:hypothetical protein
MPGKSQRYDRGGVFGVESRSLFQILFIFALLSSLLIPVRVCQVGQIFVQFPSRAIDWSEVDTPSIPILAEITTLRTYFGSLSGKIPTLHHISYN